MVHCRWGQSRNSYAEGRKEHPFDALDPLCWKGTTVSRQAAAGVFSGDFEGT